MALGATHWNVTPTTRKRANRLAGLVPTRWNTYAGHGLPPGRGERKTVDFWGLGGRGDPLPERHGDEIVKFVLARRRRHRIALVIWWSWWWRPGFGWQPYSGFHGNHGPGPDAHVHVGWK